MSRVAPYVARPVTITLVFGLAMVTASVANAAFPNVNVRLARAFSGFNKPLGVTSANDGTGRLWVVEKTGKIKVITKGRTSLWLDLSSKITPGSNGPNEQGLLGLAFSPRYRNNGRFYVNYTDRWGNTVIARYVAIPSTSSKPKITFAGTVLWVDQPAANHNGGCLQFGPDRYLYVGMGDGGPGGDPAGRAQNRNTLLGKVLRLDADGVPNGGTHRPIPTNPFVGTPNTRPEIWSYGVRNPWRFSFDRTTGDVWMADVGQNTWEEVDFQPAGQGGQNWGWVRWEGDHAYPPGSVEPTRTGFTFPIAEYGHLDSDPNGGESVTGGYVYRGAKYPGLAGIYFYADYISGRVWGLKRTVAGQDVVVDGPQELLDTSLFISSFGESDTGQIYMTAFNGSVYRLQQF
ncbi:MAG: PQQ-dependent sugar dehydrogenase [Coriobacteriales bacterium]|nr:PQQ-dependent sugar dehydrogenase [Coriobacteriales bacterium]